MSLCFVMNAVGNDCAAARIAKPVVLIKQPIFSVQNINEVVGHDEWGGSCALYTYELGVAIALLSFSGPGDNSTQAEFAPGATGKGVHSFHLCLQLEKALALLVWRRLFERGQFVL